MHKELGAQNAAAITNEENWENDYALPHFTQYHPQMLEHPVLEDIPETRYESDEEMFTCETSDDDIGLKSPSEEQDFSLFLMRNFSCYTVTLMV